jgi:hypothetical protein
MDMTITAQALSQAAPAVAALSPLQLALLAGPLLAHLFQAVKPKMRVPEDMKPYLAVASMVGATTMAATATGTPLPAALGLGIATAAVGTGWHVGFLSSSGVLGTLQGFVDAMQMQAFKPAPVVMQATAPASVAPAQPVAEVATESGLPVAQKVG